MSLKILVVYISFNSFSGVLFLFAFKTYSTLKWLVVFWRVNILLATVADNSGTLNNLIFYPVGYYWVLSVAIFSTLSP